MFIHVNIKNRFLLSHKTKGSIHGVLPVITHLLSLFSFYFLSQVYKAKVALYNDYFPETITANEQMMLHMAVDCRSR